MIACAPRQFVHNPCSGFAISDKPLICKPWLPLDISLGKGEAESSILSCSTIYPLHIKRLPAVPVCSFLVAWQELAGTNRDCALSGVQNACSLFMGGSQ